MEHKTQNHAPLRPPSPSLRRSILRRTKRKNRSRPKQHETQPKRTRPRRGLRNRPPLPTRRQISQTRRRHRHLVKNPPRSQKTHKTATQCSCHPRRRRLHTLPKPNLRPSFCLNPPAKHAKPPQNPPRNKKSQQTSIHNRRNRTEKEVHPRTFHKTPQQSRTENFHTENKSATKRTPCHMQKLRENSSLHSILLILAVGSCKIPLSKDVDLSKSFQCIFCR